MYLFLEKVAVEDGRSTKYCKKPTFITIKINFMLKVICEKITNSLHLLLFCILKVYAASFFMFKIKK